MPDTTANIRANQLVDRESVWWKKYYLYPAHEAVRLKRRFSIKKQMEISRSKDFAGVDGKTIKLNNNFAPCLARRLIKDYPDIEPYIETRRSMYDD